MLASRILKVEHTTLVWMTGHLESQWLSHIVVVLDILNAISAVTIMMAATILIAVMMVDNFVNTRS